MQDDDDEAPISPLLSLSAVWQNWGNWQESMKAFSELIFYIVCIKCKKDCMTRWIWSDCSSNPVDQPLDHDLKLFIPLGHSKWLINQRPHPSYIFAGSETRMAGKIFIFSGLTGHVLQWVTVPDGRESYYSPVMYQWKDGTNIVLFGTGERLTQGLCGIYHSWTYMKAR